MLSRAQKAYLRKEALNLTISYQIGKNEISESVVEMLSNALEAHELIKISLLKSVSMSVNEVAITLSETLNCEVVDTRGRTILLFKQNRKKPIYKISKV